MFWIKNNKNRSTPVNFSFLYKSLVRGEGRGGGGLRFKLSSELIQIVIRVKPLIYLGCLGLSLVVYCQLLDYIMVIH